MQLKTHAKAAKVAKEESRPGSQRSGSKERRRNTRALQTLRAIRLATLIHVPLVPFFRFEAIDIFGGLVSRAFAFSLNHLVQRSVHIFGHAAGVATDIKMRAGFEPRK